MGQGCEVLLAEIARFRESNVGRRNTRDPLVEADAAELGAWRVTNEDDQRLWTHLHVDAGCKGREGIPLLLKVK